jgi:hypothetical protein
MPLNSPTTPPRVPKLPDLSRKDENFGSFSDTLSIYISYFFIKNVSVDIFGKYLHKIRSK